MGRYFDGPAIPERRRDQGPCKRTPLAMDEEVPEGSYDTSAIASVPEGEAGAGAGTLPSVAPMPTSDSLADNLRYGSTLTATLQELENGREVRDEFLRMIEKTKEYNAYEHDVDFEMSMVRRRYVASKEPMTPARRSQMQAHLGKVHQALLEEHAEKAADVFVNSLAEMELDQLRALFEGMDAKGVNLMPTADRTAGLEGLQRVVEQFSETAAAAMQAMPKSAVTPPSARAEQEDSYAFPTTPRHIAPSPSSSDEEGAGVQGGEEGGKRGGAGAGGRGRRHRRRLVPDDE